MCFVCTDTFDTNAFLHTLVATQLKMYACLVQDFCDVVNGHQVSVTTPRRGALV